MNIQKKITTISILLMLLSCEISLIPLQNDYSSNKNCITCKEKRFFANRESKKDVFVSRGWGAGGMPFSVLYMNPSHSSKAPATSEGSYRSPPQQFANRQTEKSLPQVRTSMTHSRQKGIGRVPHSAIPHLFVSYSWGPLGK